MKTKEEARNYFRKLNYTRKKLGICRQCGDILAQIYYTGKKGLPMTRNSIYCEYHLYMKNKNQRRYRKLLKKKASK